MAVRDRPVVLIAGGGVAALEAVLALRSLVGPDIARLELLSPQENFYDRPLSVLQPFDAGTDWHLPLPRFAADNQVDFVRDGIAAVDPARKRVRTLDGAARTYDLLLVATGAIASPAIDGAITYHGPRDAGAVSSVLAELETGMVSSVAFALPGDRLWAIPLYELALMTAVHARAQESEIRIVFVTPEQAPLELFGKEASELASELIRERGVEVLTGRIPQAFYGGQLHVDGGPAIDADRVIALATLRGPFLSGLPFDDDGFVPVDAHGAVTGVDGVWAAGDVTTFPVKQGGLATQQADAAAEAIAARLGAAIDPRPFRPVLRGMLLTGGAPAYLRAWSRDETGEARGRPLWWPPTKIAGRHLPGYLTREAGAPMPVEGHDDEVPGRRIDVDLQPYAPR